MVMAGTRNMKNTGARLKKPRIVACPLGIKVAKKSHPETSKKAPSTM